MYIDEVIIKPIVEQRGYLFRSYKRIRGYVKVNITCPAGHECQMDWWNFHSGRECNKCSYERRGKKRRTKFTIAKSTIEKEGYRVLTPASLYQGVHTKLQFQCPAGHVYRATDASFRHLGSRCPRCAHKSVDCQLVRNYLKEYQYELLSKVYDNSFAKLSIKCPVGHIYRTAWATFQSGHRCPKCSHRRAADNNKRDIEEIRESVHREGFDLISTEYKTCKTKMLFKCPKGHLYESRWNDFQQGYRCPECGRGKSEAKLGEILRQIFPSQVRQQDNLDFLGRQKVDFSIRDLQLAFEYDGEQHFRPTQFMGVNKKSAQHNFLIQQRRDQRKNQLCKENGYHLVRIAYNEDLTLENVKIKINKVLGAK